MSDLINRKTAIDEIKSAADNWNIAEPFNEGIRAGYTGAARILRSLPSEQPEITEEQVLEYCHNRCLNLITSETLAKLLR